MLRWKRAFETSGHFHNVEAKRKKKLKNRRQDFELALLHSQHVRPIVWKYQRNKKKKSRHVSTSSQTENSVSWRGAKSRWDTTHEEEEDAPAQGVYLWILIFFDGISDCCLFCSGYDASLAGPSSVSAQHPQSHTTIHISHERVKKKEKSP